MSPRLAGLAVLLLIQRPAAVAAQDRTGITYRLPQASDGEELFSEPTP
jgi:hypothetical protein